MNLAQYQPPIVAILRGLQPDDAAAVAQALHGAGIRMLEVPFNRPHAAESIATIAALGLPDVLLGGGTMLTHADVDAVRAAGGPPVRVPALRPGPDPLRRQGRHGLRAWHRDAQ